MEDIRGRYLTQRKPSQSMPTKHPGPNFLSLVISRRGCFHLRQLMLSSKHYTAHQRIHRHSRSRTPGGPSLRIFKKVSKSRVLPCVTWSCEKLRRSPSRIRPGEQAWAGTWAAPGVQSTEPDRNSSTKPNRRVNLSWGSGQVRFITRPKSRTMRAKRNKRSRGNRTNVPK